MRIIRAALLLSVCSLGACGSSDGPADGGIDLSQPEPDLSVVGPGSCTPYLATAFQPSYFPASGAHQGKCTAQQIDDAIVALPGVNDAGMFTFPDWVAANKTCADCLITADFAGPAWGPWLTDTRTKTITTNQWGCVEVVGGKNDCVVEGEALQECIIAACTPWCDVTPDDPGTLAALNVCLGQASHTVCNSYSQAVALCELGLDGDAGDLSACLNRPATFQEFARRLGNLFCGS